MFPDTRRDSNDEYLLGVRGASYPLDILIRVIRAEPLLCLVDEFSETSEKTSIWPRAQEIKKRLRARSSQLNHMIRCSCQTLSNNCSMDPSPSALRNPSGLFYQKDELRRSIIIAYWIVIIFAFPLWWTTTSIQRLSLPSSRVQDESRRRLELPIAICVESHDLSLIQGVKHALKNSASDDPSRWKGISVNVVGETDCCT